MTATNPAGTIEYSCPSCFHHGPHPVREDDGKGRIEAECVGCHTVFTVYGIGEDRGMVTW